MACRSVFLCLGLALGAATADAQGVLTYEMARNKVGLLRYCKQQGMLDAKVADDAIEGAQGGVSTASSFQQAHVSKPEGDLAEKNGEAGLWGPRHSQMEKMARSQVLTPTELCQKWADEGAASRTRSAPAAQQ